MISSDWLEEFEREMGYTVCPISPAGYEMCDGNCLHCQLAKEYDGYLESEYLKEKHCEKV